MDNCRIDKWLWATRIFKTRSQATAACKAGKVKIQDLAAKPSRLIQPDEIVTVRKDGMIRTFKVIQALNKRVSATLVVDYMEDLTTAEEYDEARARNKAEGFRQPRGAGRPTKRRRRMLDRFFGKSRD
ncbi:MAG: S4 domain-containing protein [Opitutales bacterium]